MRPILKALVDRSKLIQSVDVLVFDQDGKGSFLKKCQLKLSEFAVIFIEIGNISHIDVSLTLYKKKTGKNKKKKSQILSTNSIFITISIIILSLEKDLNSSSIYLRIAWRSINISMSWFVYIFFILRETSIQSYILEKDRWNTKRITINIKCLRFFKLCCESKYKF